MADLVAPSETLHSAAEVMGVARTKTDPARLDLLVASLADVAAVASQRRLHRAELLRLVHALTHSHALVVELLTCFVTVARAADTYTYAATRTPADDPVGAAELCRTIGHLVALLAAPHTCARPPSARTS